MEKSVIFVGEFIKIIIHEGYSRVFGGAFQAF